MVTIEVTQDFLDHRTEKASMYNRRGRDERKFLMDLDAEIYEYFMINQEIWEEEPDDWKIDAYMQGPAGNMLAIDVKFVSKWYNISDTKMHNIIQQRHCLDGFMFMEWIERPDRPLELGDEVVVRQLGYIEYDELLDIIKVSRGKWGGFYADVRDYLGTSGFSYDHLQMSEL